MSRACGCRSPHANRHSSHKGHHSAGEFAALILISNRHPWCAPAQGDDQHLGGAEVAHQMPTMQLKLWWHQPPYQAPSGKPSLQFTTRGDFSCGCLARCGSSTSCVPTAVLRGPSGQRACIYTNIRTVLDLKDFYYLAAEYMDCNHSSRMLVV